jgi:hypothetical protein
MDLVNVKSMHVKVAHFWSYNVNLCIVTINAKLYIFFNYQFEYVYDVGVFYE